LEDEEHISGEEVDPQTEDDEELAEKVDELDIGDYEEGWSTEGEGEEEGRGGLSGEVGKKQDQGETVPLRDVAREVAKDAEEQEDERTRVLSVTELEDLFIGSAPPLSGKSTP
jgi:large subunit GTPase 1